MHSSVPMLPHVGYVICFTYIHVIIFSYFDGSRDHKFEVFKFAL